MHRAVRVRVTLILMLGAWLMVVPSAQAYIDPGTTTVIFQAVVAGIAAAGTGIALFWSRIRSFFRRESSHGEEIDSASEAESTTEQV